MLPCAELHHRCHSTWGQFRISFHLLGKYKGPQPPTNLGSDPKSLAKPFNRWDLRYQRSECHQFDGLGKQKPTNDKHHRYISLLLRSTLFVILSRKWQQRFPTWSGSRYAHSQARDGWQGLPKIVKGNKVKMLTIKDSQCWTALKTYHLPEIHLIHIIRAEIGVYWCIYDGH